MKKILYLEHPQVDVAAYLIYKGLCEVYGKENIVDFPYKRAYRAEKEFYNDDYLNSVRVQMSNRATIPYGIPPLSPGEDIVSCGPQVDSGGPYNWGYFIPEDLDQPGAYPLVGLRSPDANYNEDKIIKMLLNGEFAFIILSTSHRVCTIALARLRDAVGGLNKLPPIIYTDNGERDELNEHWAHVFNPSIIFKCCLTEDVQSEYKRKYNWKLESLPCSNYMIGNDLEKHFKVDKNAYNDENKEYDVYYQFLGKENRESVISTMEDYCKNSGVSTYPYTADYFKYLQILAKSKIVITHRGVCRGTSRYWDIAMFKTLMMCDGTMGTIHPYPFEDGKTAVFYSDNPDTQKDELIDKCNFYLKNDTERNKIALAGMEHLRKYHTSEARVRQMLSVIKNFGIELPK